MAAEKLESLKENPIRVLIETIFIHSFIHPSDKGKSDSNKVSNFGYILSYPAQLPSLPPTSNSIIWSRLSTDGFIA